ncbi:MAG: response regulator [Phycisphaerales bacterium]
MQQQSRKIRVLSVDDHAFLSEGLRARLALEPDMEVVSAASRADGLAARVRDEAIDVLLLDIEMPGSDPFEAIAEIRKQCPSARAIVLSAYVRDRYVDAAVKAGAWGYLSKSDPPETIVAAIRDVASGKFTFGPTVLERCRQLGRDEPGLSLGGTAPGSTSGAEAGTTEAKPGAITSRLGALTPRELQILRMIGKGMSRTEIAKVIFRSPKTVDAHRAAIMEKLAIHDRVELARYAIREGLVEI